MALKLHALLDSIKVTWTSTGARIGNIVFYNKLPALGGHDVADVNVEIRESVVTC
jgi:hypothetical protein